MWLEIYRWYDTRLLGTRNLLLERRAAPRFAALESIGRFRIAFPGELHLPISRDPVFWTMNCRPEHSGAVPKVTVPTQERLCHCPRNGKSYPVGAYHPRRPGFSGTGQLFAWQPYRSSPPCSGPAKIRRIP